MRCASCALQHCPCRAGLRAAAALAMLLLHVNVCVNAAASTCASAVPACSAEVPTLVLCVPPCLARGHAAGAAAAVAASQVQQGGKEHSEQTRRSLLVQHQQASTAAFPVSAAADPFAGDISATTPQRVLPTSLSGIKITAQQQQQQMDYLRAVLQAPSNFTAAITTHGKGAVASSNQVSWDITAAAAAAAGGSSVNHRALLAHQAAAAPPSAPAPTPPVEMVPTAVQVTHTPGGMIYLSSGTLRVGVDTAAGGALTYLASARMPQGLANINLVNTWDRGRLVQQSYYGCVDGSCWHDKPWRWNPIQGGSWQHRPPKLLGSGAEAGVVRVSAVPRNWSGQQLLDDVVMNTRVQLVGEVVKVRFSMRYMGTAAHPMCHQETPAAFLDRRLSILATYTGKYPWTNGTLDLKQPGAVGEYYTPSERWAAYVDAQTGYGVGVYTPIAESLAAYRVGPDDNSAKSDTSYLALIVKAQVKPRTEFWYDTYLTVGRVDEVRQRFAAIASKVNPGLSPQRRVRTVGGDS